VSQERLSTSPLVVVTGVADAETSSLAGALAWRLGCPLVALDQIHEELAAEAADTPHEWLRYDAEAELARRLDAFDGRVVVDVRAVDQTERVRELVKRWWDDVVEVRCETAHRSAAGGPESLGAPRTVVVDTTRPVDLGDVVSAVRRDTGARRRVQRR
jgi:hypothetical protein